MKRLVVAVVLSLWPLAALPPVAPAARHYAIVLEDAPVARAVSSRYEMHSQRALDRAARIDAAQDALRRRLAGHNVRVLGSMKNLLNVVFVAAPENEALALKALPGVRGVVRVGEAKLHLNSAVSLANIVAARNTVTAGAPENAGAGVKIGIIDTGIDISHPGFQDDSLQPPAGFPKCVGDTVAKTGDCAYTNGKVIVARSYIQLAGQGYTTENASAAETSRPDDTSMRDRVGHGTAVAMAAAGVRHPAPVATIDGSAPKAWLGSYKVFGSPGITGYSTSFTAILKALEDAYADGMDIVTLSLGFPAWYGPNDKGAACYEQDPQAPCEIEAQAVETAVQKGMIVVASAGNDGDAGVNYPTLSTIHTPGIAPSAITVGGTRNGHQIYSSVRVTGTEVPGALGSIAAVFGDGPQIGNPVTAPVRDAGGQVCTPLAAGSMNGAIAVIQRGACTFVDKVRYAQDAGAAGVIIYCADTQYCKDGGDVLFAPVGLASTRIPAVLISRTQGSQLLDYVKAHSDAQAKLDPALAEYVDQQANIIAEFASRGPSIAPDTGIKPEVVAPATQIYTATQHYDATSDMYSPQSHLAFDGTSFSAPLVAGVAALVIQAHPGWTPAQVKSAIVNTARQLGNVPASERITGGGAGLVDADAAVRTNVTVEPATLPFGLVTPAVIGTPKPLTVTNGSSTALTLAVEPADPRIQVTPATVPANKAIEVAVKLLSKPQPGSYSGSITIRGGAVDLRVPYHYLVGDGVPANVFAITSSSFTGVPGERIPGQITYIRAIDQYGAAVENAPVEWTTSGGAYIETETGGQLRADTQTWTYGEAAAFIYLGNTPGPQTITAKVGTGTSALSYTFDAVARPKPVINDGGVVNLASRRILNDNGVPAIAPGSYIEIYGMNLSDTTLEFNQRLATGYVYLPMSLADVSVSFDAGTVSVPGRMRYISPLQVNVQVPWELQGQKSALLKVRIGQITSALYSIVLADAAPGIFEYTEAGTNTMYAAAQIYPSYQLVGSGNPAKPGDWLMVYVNGLGPVNNQPASGELSLSDPLSKTTNPVTVTIGGKAAETNFAGLSPGYIGLYQVNVKVPDGLSGVQPVVVSVNGNNSKPANILIQ